MCKIIRVFMWRVLVLTAGGCLWQAGCIRTIQQEFEVLFRPEANPTLIQDSFLVNLFGAEILRLFN